VNGNPKMWTVILGNNGSGKTTVLQALVRSNFITKTDDIAKISEYVLFLMKSIRKSIKKGSVLKMSVDFNQKAIIKDGASG
jgi:predicted ATP-binding protein involved in virulence